ncbi:hypothetical protein QJS10_CPB11g01831 [Acorus calamus]|uniref:PGG domain-containing protein n=1 Tax=Acorus calamus TaxID=4465 RepID=A0AAV9DXI3_ACOCL|nr:hypothetical protein QJS10_CPB11g01831 [Acorus calamus]
MGRSEVFFKEVRGALLMVAALIATVTFSAGIYPPGGFWQDDPQGKDMAGKPIMADKNKPIWREEWKSKGRGRDG